MISSPFPLSDDGKAWTMRHVCYTASRMGRAGPGLILDWAMTTDLSENTIIGVLRGLRRCGSDYRSERLVSPGEYPCYRIGIRFGGDDRPERIREQCPGCATRFRNTQVSCRREEIQVIGEYETEGGEAWIGQCRICKAIVWADELAPGRIELKGV